jgi:signal transduction histidine kinase
LAISRNLATTLGGDITFVSVEGEGTTFVVRIAARLPDPPTGRESVIT